MYKMSWLTGWYRQSVLDTKLGGSLKLVSLCFHSDRESQNARGVSASGVDMVPGEEGEVS